MTTWVLSWVSRICLLFNSLYVYSGCNAEKGIHLTTLREEVGRLLGRHGLIMADLWILRGFRKGVKVACSSSPPLQWGAESLQERADSAQKVQVARSWERTPFSICSPDARQGSYVSGTSWSLLSGGCLLHSLNWMDKVLQTHQKNCLVVFIWLVMAPQFVSPPHKTLQLLKSLRYPRQSQCDRNTWTFKSKILRERCAENTVKQTEILTRSNATPPDIVRSQQGWSSFEQSKTHWQKRQNLVWPEPD